MSMNAKIFPVVSKPGIKRDGTAFEGDYYTDGRWVRWQRSLPRKIGGFVSMGQSTDIARGCDVFTQDGEAYIHYGTQNNIFQASLPVSNDQIVTTADRTPNDGGFVQDSNNLWQFAEMYDAGSDTMRIIAFAAPNLTDIDNTTQGNMFLGDITTTDRLTTIAASNISGGCCVLAPYLFGYGSDGEIFWSVPNEPTDFTDIDSGAGDARVTGGKIVYGLQTRAGAGNAPAGLFWATDALIRAVFVGDPAIFDFDRIATSYSIMSSQCVVEYDGIYYWVGTDRFLMYNGVIQEVPNNLNRNFFFDNIDINNSRQKVWGMKVPAYGEIWWFFPFGDSPECNHVVIFNVREGTWYDTPLDRVTGFSAEIFPHPIMFDTDATTNGSYYIYKHEKGTDEVIGTQSLAIPSYFETNDFFSQVPTVQAPPWQDMSLQSLRFEPDFVLSGSLTMTIAGRKYPQSTPITLSTDTITSSTEKIDIRQQARIMTFRFESNEAGGDYQMGRPLVLIDQGDKRPAGSGGQ